MQISEFYPYVLPEVLGCPDPLLLQALRLSAIEFCRETGAWCEIQEDPVTLVNGVADYDIDVPTGAQVLTVRDVWVGGRRLEPITLKALQQALPDWRTAQGSEPSFYNAVGERGAIRVYPTPANVTGQALVLRAVYTPTLSATTLPDFMGQRQAEVIASGAKARLLLMAGSPWANPALGGYYRELFHAGVQSARIEEIHERVPGTVRISPPRFGC